MNAKAHSLEVNELIIGLRRAVEGALEGKEEVVRLAFIALIAQGHILLEDVPGVGKTTLARALAEAVGGAMNRVQFTNDLLPSDVLGISVFDQKESKFSLRKGAIFCNVLLADEINRASPRTQSALLEAMNEGQVSIDGETYRLPDPFFVVATQNPQDFSGTFPLPESQLDRFMMRLEIGYPPSDVETSLFLSSEGGQPKVLETVLEPGHLLRLQAAVAQVKMDPSLGQYIQQIMHATRTSSHLAVGASTRAGLSLARAARARALVEGRSHCLPDDIYELAVPLLAHRVRLASHSEGYVPNRDEAETVIQDLISRIAAPL